MAGGRRGPSECPSAVPELPVDVWRAMARNHGLPLWALAVVGLGADVVRDEAARRIQTLFASVRSRARFPLEEGGGVSVYRRGRWWPGTLRGFQLHEDDPRRLWAVQVNHPARLHGKWFLFVESLPAWHVQRTGGGT